MTMRRLGLWVLLGILLASPAGAVFVPLTDSQGLEFIFRLETTAGDNDASGSAFEASYTREISGVTTENGGTTTTTPADAFDGYSALIVNGVHFTNNPRPEPRRECGARQLLFGTQMIGDLEVTRKVFVPEDDEFARWLNIITNTGNNDVTVSVETNGNVGADNDFTVDDSSDGDDVPEITDTWIATNGDYDGGPAHPGIPDVKLGHLMWGAGAEVGLDFVRFEIGSGEPGDTEWGYEDFLLGPGETAILMNFATGQESIPAAAAKSAELEQLPAVAVRCMSRTERNQVVNFAATAPAHILAGRGGQGGPEVRIFDVTDPTNPSQAGSFFAYNPSFGGGVNVAGLDNDRVATGPGSGGGPHVRFFDVSNPSSPQPLGGFFPYPSDFRGGVSPSAGDVDDDGLLDLVTAPGAGGEPLVRVFDIADPSSPAEISSFFAYNQSFRGAVNTAAGDVNGDGFADVITGPVGAGGPHVRIFDVSDPGNPEPLDQFFAYSREFRGGVFVAAGDVTGDGLAEVITAPAVAGGPHVRVFTWNAAQGRMVELTSFFAYQRDFRGGVRLATADVDGDGVAEVLTGPGSGRVPELRAWDIMGGRAFRSDVSFLAFENTAQDGIFVGGLQ